MTVGSPTAVAYHDRTERLPSQGSHHASLEDKLSINDNLPQCKLYLACKNVVIEGERRVYYAHALENLAAKTTKTGTGIYRPRFTEDQTYIETLLVSRLLPLVHGQQACVIHSFATLKNKQPSNQVYQYGYIELQDNPAAKILAAEIEKDLHHV